METGLVFNCKVGSLDDTAFAVAKFTLQEYLSELFTLELLVASRDPNIDYRAQLDQPASFSVKIDGEIQRTVHGIVTHISRKHTGKHLTYYSLTIRPKMFRLTLVQDSRIFHHASIPDILNTLLQESSVPVRSKINNAHQTREYVTQKRETTYDFWRRLAAEEGISFWFEEEGLFYADTHKAMMGGPELIFNPQPESVATGNVTFRLELAANLLPQKVIAKDRLVSNPDYGFIHEKTGENVTSTDYPIFESYGRFNDDGEGKAFTQYRTERLRVGSEIGNGESNCINLRPGLKFRITRHPATELNANWQILGVTHQGSCPQALEEESGEAGTWLTNHYDFIADRYDWRPAFIPKPVVDGCEVAEIVGPDGEEIYTDKLGRVKIHFHWNRYDPADDRASCWVRAAQGWNGDNFGFMAIPRIGQEVIVDYLNGDVDRPIITGCNYNGRNSPPLDLPGEKTRTTFKTKTHKGEGFNELRFEDESGRQEVFIHAQKDMNTKVLNDRSTTVGTNHTETIGNDQTVTVKNNQTLLVENNRQKTVNVSQKTEVKENDIETVGIKQAIEVGKLYELTVGDSLTIKVGESKLVMKKDGTIILKGVRILLDADNGIKNVADTINLN